MSFTFERTYDAELIRAVFTHPKLYRAMGDDFSPRPEDFQPLFSEHVWYVVAKNGQNVAGIFLLHPQNTICWEIHAALLPHTWGRKTKPNSLDALREVIAWTFANTPCLRLIASIPAYERWPFLLATHAGFEEYGCNRAAFQKNQRLHDLRLVGISKV